MTEFHPSQYDALANAHRAARLQCWTAAIASMLLVGVLASVKSPLAKLFASGSLLAINAAVQPSRSAERKLRGMVRDGEDLSAAAYQQYLWEAFKPRQVIEAQIIEPEPEIPLLPVDSLIGYPSILIHGAQGSGKTSLAAYILQRRREAGHAITVLDPHAGYRQWEGLRVVGAGMDFAAIDAEINRFMELVQASYAQHRAQPTQFAPATLFVDEFTNLASRCKTAGELFKSGVSDLRKINQHLLIVSHARTLAGLGDARGMAKTRDNGLLEIFLDVDLDLTTGTAKPALTGTIKYPGKDAMPIAIAPWMQGRMSFPALTSSSNSIDRLESLLHQDSDAAATPSDELLHQLSDAMDLQEMPEVCRHILKFACSKEWFTVRDLKRGKWHIKQISTDELSHFLNLLHRSEWLQTRQIDKATQYRIFDPLREIVEDWG
jgi:hypothetical protein